MGDLGTDPTNSGILPLAERIFSRDAWVHRCNADLAER